MKGSFTSRVLFSAMLLTVITVNCNGREPMALSGSVGSGGANSSSDVKAVQLRLRELGFTWVDADGQIGPITIAAIRLFQSIKDGESKVVGDGRIDVNGDTHKWLEAKNAPRWTKMTESGPGFKNIELGEIDDDHDFGTTWLDSTIKNASRSYQKKYRSLHNSSLVTVNDASPAKGGNSPDHSGHETGLNIDLRLPKTDHSEVTPGGRTYKSSDYDQAAARAIIKAFRSQELVNTEQIFFNDPDLISEGLCKSLSGHDNHIHVGIKAPVRDDN